MSAAASSSATPSAAQVLSLFRSLLRAAREFPDYNIREYTKRRTIDSFRHNATLSDPSQISTAFAHGKSQLAVVKRQAVVYSLYDSPLRSVMELQQSLKPHEREVEDIVGEVEESMAEVEVGEEWR
ncbi:hypothetical protein JHK86_022318 [Glycine max]|nr:hypothetical protein JHK86_022318 [Glycine max]